MLSLNIGMMISAVINLHALNTVVNDTCNGFQTWVQDPTKGCESLIAGSLEESIKIQLT